VSARRSESQRAKHPLILSWHADDSFPMRPIRALHATADAPPAEPPPNVDTGGGPFDFCAHVRRLLDDVVRRCPALAHVQMNRILLATTQARSFRKHGLQARVTPLRFNRGALTRQRRGVTYQVQRYFLGEHEYLYLMTFCLPRFLDQSFDDKFVTLFHEMYHLSPACDGDLRRHDGRCYLHTDNQRGYDRHMLELARAYLASQPDPRLHAFLRLSFAQLLQRHGTVNGVFVPRPKVVPLLGSVAISAASKQPPADSAVE
jgi:hypothetical protein